jgi:hypothetical protein
MLADADGRHAASAASFSSLASASPSCMPDLIVSFRLAREVEIVARP